MPSPISPAPDRTARYVPLLLALVALAARWPAFGNPLVHVDEDFYLVAAQRMWAGDLMYVDVWDRKPIGLFLLYLPAAALPWHWGVVAYQVEAWAFVVATAWVLWRLARAAGWARGALAGALLYILWLDIADGQGGQAPVFYNLPMALAAWATMAAGGHAARGRRRLGLGAMLLVGVSLQIKYSVVFEGAWFGLWLLWGEWRASRSVVSTLAHGAALAATALLPTALAVAAYAVLGHLHDFLYANFLSILARGKDPADEQWLNITVAGQILLPLLVLALAGLAVRGADPRRRTRGRFLRLWLAAAVLGFAAFGSWFNHYTLPVMVPAAVCAAAWLGTRAGRWTAIPLLVLAFVAGQVVIGSQLPKRGDARALAGIAREAGHGRRALFLYSGPVMLYPATGRPTLTRYLFPTHLFLQRESGATGVVQLAEVQRILSRRPGVVVVQGFDGGERAEVHLFVLHWLVRHGYRLTRCLALGNRAVDVWRAPDEPPSADLSPTPAIAAPRR